jgi:hypothetical protein
MHLHPHSVLPFVQLKSARTTRDPKVPMMATGAPSEFSLASNDDAEPAAFVEDVGGGEREIEFEHGLTNILQCELRILSPRRDCGRP